MERPDLDLDDAWLRRTGSVKWNHAAEDVLPAWVAEIDVRPAPVIAAALHGAVDRGALGYPPDDGTGLAEAAAAFAAERFGWTVDPARVLATGDVMAGISLVLETLCADAPVVVPVPSYPPFLHAVPLTRRQLVEVPCPTHGSTAGRPVLDLDAIGAALAAGARTVLLANPHNPLGRAWTVAELTALAELCHRHGARVVSDEIHAPLVLPGAAHVPYATVGGEGVTTVLAASKAWNVPGLKCAQIVAGSAADAAGLRALPHVANHGTSPLGIVASVAAYRAGGPWLDGLLDHLTARRAQFAALLAEHLPGLDWWPMEATYLAWLDAGPTGLRDPAATALARGRVMVNPGPTFTTLPGYERFVRVNLATSAERLERIVTRLAAAWT